jgi:polysaccharide export outer membrane protein
MRSLPPYMIEPPDILLLDTVRMIPKPPYTVSALDVLLLRVAEPLPNQPIDGTYTVAPDGTINLGYSYGLVRVGGLTLEEVERAIRLQLGRVLKEPQVAVGLAQFRGVQQARGEHLVRPDGTINLGNYGCVYVAGLTLLQAKVAIERHLSQFILEPEVTVDVFAYNSKDYFIVVDGAGYGQQVFRFPITGNETVLRAMSLIQGLPAVASKKKIWVARPAPANHECVQILPVDWMAITQAGATATNYQIFPGDRIYIHSDPLICLDNSLAKILAPIERLFSAVLLGTTTVQSFRSNGNGGSGVGFIAPLR